jgi:2-oxoglutarate ferredoxin oxidoreductase subunit beta
LVEARGDPGRPPAQRKPHDYKGRLKPIWCPGCGDFGVLSALYKALAAENLAPEEVAIISGIGCSGRIPEFVDTYGFHVVHGRALPTAMGVKLANPRLTVIAAGGDGDAFAIGGTHLLHAARRNPGLTYLVMDNSIYGLTKGQASPTSQWNLQTKSTPFGTVEMPLNPLALMIVNGASFVARAYSARLQHMTEVFVKALRHKGFSFVQTLSPCITYHDTYDALNPAVEPLPEDHDPSDRVKALDLALTEDRPHLGVFFQEERPAYEELVLGRTPGQALEPVEELASIMESYSSG